MPENQDSTSTDWIEFWKMSGSGNDFIIFDNREGVVRDWELETLVARVCRRRESVGADGLIAVVGSEQYDFAWRFFNADGGEVEMCGNGGRCVARFAYLKGIAGSRMTFETRVGPVSAEVKGRVVKVLMPTPGGLERNIALSPEPTWIHWDFINTGVPHVVIQVDDLSDHPVVEEGRAIRHHSAFSPGGTNVNFMKVLDQGSIEVRTYERGVEDETLACGTGSIASALVAASRGMVRSPVRVRTRGGEILHVHFTQEGDRFREVWLEGNTSLVYKGRLCREAL
ncbi:MAG: diaminopimelate epimerase [Deltaproteobacteria bacterium]|nr:diaminopimelate epimerase [Deltaproteobacteria bacterium]